MTTELPRDTESERATIGSLLHPSGSKYIESVAHVLGPRDFFDPLWRTIYEGILELHRTKQPIDYTFLQDLLKSDRIKKEDFETAIRELLDNTPTAAHAEFYAKKVAEISRKRQMARLALDTLEMSKNGATASDLSEYLRAEIYEYDRNLSSENTFKVLSSSELSQGEFDVEYLVSRTLVANQPAVIAGPSKAMKTTISVALAIALATARAFLGKLSVYRQCRVLMMSGESGLHTLKETAQRIASTHDFALGDISDLLWSIDLPQLGNEKQMAELSRLLDAEGINVLVVDPLYLMMPGADAGNMMIQGKYLRDLSAICQTTETTPILVAHTTKIASRSFEPLELADIAWAGIGEYARQWIFVNRRERYEPGSGCHRLWIATGGSAGHSMLKGLNIEEGNQDASAGRSWDVTLLDGEGLKEERQERQIISQELKESERLEYDRKAVCRALAKGPNTKHGIRGPSGLNNNKISSAIETLLDDGMIVPCKIKKGKRTCDGFELST